MSKRGRPPHPDILTPREWEVLALLRKGLSNDEIAQRLDISLAGAKYHVSEILSKLGVSSREEAARWERPTRPWWARAAAPFTFLWRKGSASWSAGAVVAMVGVALLAGIALLVWGLVRTSAGDTNAESVIYGSAACPGGPEAISDDAPLFTYSAPDGTIWLANEDSATRLVCSATASRSADWSSSGRYLAYVTRQGVLRLLDVSTGEDVILDDGSQGSLLHASGGAFLSWSPTNETLLYGEYDPADLRLSAGIWLVKPGEQPSRLNLQPGALGVTWTPTGQLMYEVPTEPAAPTYSRTGEIFELTPDQQELRKLADGVYPSWSPDGGLLAYWNEDRGGSSYIGDIVIVDPDNGQEVSLGEFQSDEHPNWAPDQSRHIFHNLEIDIEAGTATPLFDRPSVILGWSPDASKGAYVEGSAFGYPPRSLVILDLASNKTSTLHTSQAFTAHALGSGYAGVWSPDSRYFAFAAVESTDEEGAIMLYVADTDSPSVRPIWGGTVLDYVSLSFAPDGSVLLADIQVDQDHSIWLAEPDGDAFTKVASGEALLSSNRLTAWRQGAR